MIPIVTLQETDQYGAYLSEKRIYGLIQTSKIHKIESFVGDWMAIIHILKFMFGVPELYSHYLWRTDSLPTIVITATIVVTIYLINLHTILNCCAVLYVQRSNTEIFDLSDIAEEAFKDHSAPKEIMFRFRWCTFMRYFVKTLLIANCISCSYLLYNNCVYGIIHLMEKPNSSRETLIVCFVFLAVFIACLPDSLFHLLPLSMLGLAMGIIAMLMAIFNLLTINYRMNANVKVPIYYLTIPKMDTFFPYSYMCNVMPILMILRAELKPMKLLERYKFVLSLCIIIFVVLLHITSYINKHVKALNDDILPFKVTHINNMYSVVMAICFKFNQVLTIPLYIYALIKITKNMRNDYRESSMQKVTRRSVWLAMFIIFILTRQARSYCKYLASISGILLCMLVPTIIEWRIYGGGRIFQLQLRFFKIATIIIISAFVLLVSILNIHCQNTAEMIILKKQLKAIFLNGTKISLRNPVFDI